MEVLPMDEIDRITIENIRFHGKRYKMTEEEIDTLALSCFAITCELATRFLDDYLIGDKYFKVKRDLHNLIRTKCQVALAKDMYTKLGAMDAIVKSCVKQYR